jgi:hypothetical protein
VGAEGGGQGETSSERATQRGFEWDPQIGGGGETPSIEGMERGFSSMEKKGEAIGKLLEMISSPIWLHFWYWGGDREAAEVALRSAPRVVQFLYS